MSYYAHSVENRPPFVYWPHHVVEVQIAHCSNAPRKRPSRCSLYPPTYHISPHCQVQCRTEADSFTLCHQWQNPVVRLRPTELQFHSTAKYRVVTSTQRDASNATAVQTQCHWHNVLQSADSTIALGALLPECLPCRGSVPELLHAPLPLRCSFRAAIGGGFSSHYFHLQRLLVPPFFPYDGSGPLLSGVFMVEAYEFVQRPAADIASSRFTEFER